MSEQVEQTAQADSTGGVDAKLDRFFPPEQPEVQQDAQEQGEEQAEQQPAEAEGSAEETAPALEEVEWEGEKYQLPSQIKSALMRQSDYTRKTQEVAERERMVAMQMQQQQLEQAFQQSAKSEMQALAELDAAIKQYSNVDWQSLDTDTLVKTRHSLDMLKDRRSEVEKQLEGKRGEFGKKMQEHFQQTLQKANDYLAKAIPKWGSEIQKSLMQYGVSEGYSDVELGNIRDPRIIKTLWKAQQWDQLQAAKPLAAKRAAGVPPVVKPGAVKGTPSLEVQKADTIKQLHQAKDPTRKKELLDKALDLKLSRMLK